MNRRPPPSHPHTLLLTLLLLFTPFAPPASAAPAWRTTTVAVLPVVAFGPGVLDIFGDRPHAAQWRSDAARWQRTLELAFSARDQVILLGAPELSERTSRQRDLDRTRALAQERLAFGIERWRALDAQGSLTQFNHAATLLSDPDVTLTAQRLLADVEMHRGFAFMDLNEPGSARVAFARMLLLDPTRHIERGYYGKPIENQILAAEQDLSKLPDPLTLLYPTDRLTALGTRLDIDLFVVATLLAPTSSPSAPPRLELAFIDVATGATVQRDTFTLTDPALVAIDLDRIVSAWHTCALEAPRPTLRPPPSPRWHLDFGYTHHLWLRHRRTRQPLHGPGAHVGISYNSTPGLEIWGRLDQRVTLSDANADLIDAITTTHAALGIGLTIGDDRLRFSLRAGVELAMTLADIEMTTDVDCKFFNRTNPRCRGIFTADAPAVWLGLDFEAALRWAPIRSFFIAFTTGSALYALSPNIVGELNFPIYANLGFGLPF